MIPPEVAVASLRRLPHLVLLAEQFAILPFLAAVAGAMMPSIRARDGEDGDMAAAGATDDGAETWAVEFTAQYNLGEKSLCTTNRVEFRGDGTWLLRITVDRPPHPVVELAGTLTTPLETIRETITATVAALAEKPTNPSA